MFAIVEAAGWPIWFIVIASIVALAIIGERWWSLRASIVMPRNLLAQVVQDFRQNGVTPQMLARLANGSPLGQVFAAGLRNAKSPTPIIKEAIEESGRTVAIELERFLTSLGTIATISPLLGLFGTVVGMIEIFGSQTPQGGNPLQMAHGISIALYNTAFGLVVAVPAMIFYRHFRAKVDVMLVDMEMQAIKLVEIIHGERR
ncbi:MAG: flagellar motor protein MotA [Betaproteobacteria bacterium RIFCSPLOWO2_02_FULL_67_26]|nr:MAG: flagellar motor protein MotA [Betaproteobacteria bacterium RIFCSPLOWO2_02_FULL_67_26]